jgi:hypothetical protein
VVKVGVQQDIVKKEVLGEERSTWSPELPIGRYADDESDGISLAVLRYRSKERSDLVQATAKGQ